MRRDIDPGHNLLVRNAARMVTDQIALLSPAVGSNNIGDDFIEQAICRILGTDLTYLRFGIRRPLREGDLALLNSCRCAVVCGTNLYQRTWRGALTPHALDRISIPVIPFGIGASARSTDEVDLGPTVTGIVRAMHARCAAGSVRDPHTARVVSAAGVQNAILTGCPVLFWAGSPVLPQLHAVRRRRFVLTARNWLMHRWPDNVDHPVQVRFLRDLLAALRDDDVTFAIHEDFDEKLVGLLGIRREMVFRSNSAADYVRLYSEPEQVVIAMRLHAGMIAVANGVPAIFVGHDSRTYSFCEMLGLPCVELFEPMAAATCLDLARRVADGDATAFNGMNDAFARLHEGMERFLRLNELRREATASRTQAFWAGANSAGASP